MRCCHVYDCLNPGLHIRSHGGGGLQFHPHLHVHLPSSSSSPLPPLHLLGVGLSPTRIACASSSSFRCWVKSHPDCLWHLYYDTKMQAQAGVDSSSRQTGSFSHRDRNPPHFLPHLVLSRLVSSFALSGFVWSLS